mmetsp:Transcript_70023/g.137664  ORF Transcript_70023/g.137664 Transcript_70023/m.137664 type:complete len:280 (-) Transcript_70023:699-1538(-)
MVNPAPDRVTHAEKSRASASPPPPPPPLPAPLPAPWLLLPTPLPPLPLQLPPLPLLSLPLPWLEAEALRTWLGQRRWVTVISLQVRVPVLSTHTVVAHPSASTAGSFFTTAFLLAMRITPNARVTVTQMGRPSGMAATAKDTPMVNMSSKLEPCSSPTSAMAPITQKLITESFWPSWSIDTCSGVFLCSTSFISWNVFPKSVSMPVATTHARPWPCCTVVPIKRVQRLTSDKSSGSMLKAGGGAEPPLAEPAAVAFKEAAACANCSKWAGATSHAFSVW